MQEQRDYNGQQSLVNIDEAERIVLGLKKV